MFVEEIYLARCLLLLFMHIISFFVRMWWWHDACDTLGVRVWLCWAAVVLRVWLFMAGNKVLNQIGFVNHGLLRICWCANKYSNWEIWQPVNWCVLFGCMLTAVTPNN
jgi:hypothetical protein